MPEEVKPNVFGELMDKDGKQFVPQPEDVKSGPETDPLEKNPLVVELRKQVAQADLDKKSIGGNLSKQNKIIADLQEKIANIEAGKNSDTPEVPNKDIKRSKDLSQDDRDDMTQKEIELMDKLADAQEKENKAFLESQKGKKEEKDDESDDNSGQPDMKKLETTVREEALLMTGDREMANELIKKFNQFSGNEKLDDKGIKERLVEASKLVSGFTQRPTRQINGKANDGNKGSIVDDIIAQHEAKPKEGVKALKW
jgi:hypothetical protein